MNQEVASEMMDEAEGSTEEVVENTQEDVEETVERQEDVTQEEAETEYTIRVKRRDGSSAEYLLRLLQ